MTKRLIRWETLIVCAFFFAGVVVGSRYYTAFVQAGERPQFGQDVFGTAVAFACGKGYVNPAPDSSPELQLFLAEKQDTFSCAAFPRELRLRPMNVMQGLGRYLMMSIGAIWMVSGISWSGLHLYAGLMCGLSAALTYALFRLVLSRPIAIILAIVSAISSIHLVNLPHLRDYSKAPFLLALLLIVGVLVTRPVAKRRVLLLSAAAGLVLGIGLGFRNDILIGIPPAIAALLFFLPGGVRANWRLKATALLVFAAVFALSARPILRTYSSGNNTGHVALLGMMTPFDQALGVQGSQYEWGYQYTDGFAWSVANDYWVRTRGHALPYISQEYDRATSEYLLLIARHWPADMLLRSYAAILKVLEMPFGPGSFAPSVPPGVSNRTLTNLYEAMAQLGSLRAASVFVVAAAVVIGSLQSIRLTMCLLLFCLYFAGYPVLQFSPRHFFYFQFIGLGALGFVVDQGVRWGAAAWRRRGSDTAASGAVGRRAALRGLVFVVAVAASLMLPLIALRAYQQRHVRDMLEGYVVAPRSPLSMTDRAAPDGTILLQTAQLDRPNPPAAARYLVITLDPAACTAGTTSIMFRFQRTQADGTDFSYQLMLEPIVAGRTELFFPIYYLDGMRFDGIAIPEEARPCVVGTSIVGDLTRTPMLLKLKLPENWRSATLYQTLAGWETRVTGERALPPLERIPSDLLLSRAAFEGPLQPPEIVTPGALARLESGRLTAIQGLPDTPNAFVLGVGERALTRQARFVLEGDIRSGGITVGYQRNQQWDSLLNIRNRGHFLAVLAPPAEGFYSVAIANSSSSFTPRRFSLARWLNRDPEDGRTDVAIQRAGWTGVEMSGPAGSPPPLYRMPTDLDVPPSTFDAELQPPEITYRTDVVKVESGRLVALSGKPDSPTSYLLGIGERSLDARARFVVEGEARRGGIAIGFQREGRWTGTLNVMSPGRFMAVLAPPAAGIYSVMIANAAGAAAKPPFDTQTDVSIRRAGWIGADAAGQKRPPLYRMPTDLKVPPSVFDAELQPPEITFRTDVVKLTSGRLSSLSGAPESPTAYILAVGERPLGEAARFVMEGEVHRGGITIGFQRDGRWSGTVNIVSPGRFLAVLAPPVAAIYSVVVANAAGAAAKPPFDKQTDVAIRRAGWIGADAPGANGRALPPLYRMPADLSVPPAVFAAELQALDIATKSEVTKLAAGRVVSLNGMPESPSTYLLRVRERPLSEKARFVVEGEVRRGGIAIGYQRQLRWAGSVNIVSPGRFLAVLAPPAAGTYSAVIANAADAATVRQAEPGIDVVIRRAGWIGVEAAGPDELAGRRLPPTYRLPETLRISAAMLDTTLQAPDIAFKTDEVKLASGRLASLSGVPASPTGYLFGTVERPLDANARFVVEGEVKRGRISIGYLRAQQWAGSVKIANAGEFLAVIAPPAAGRYSVIFANAPGAGDRLEVVIRRAGWLEVK